MGLCVKYFNMASRLASVLERAVVTAISDELRRLDSVDDSRSAISVVQGEILPLVICPFRAVGI